MLNNPIAIFIFILFISCNEKQKQFSLLDSSKTGVNFNNIITENDSFNILNYEYLYNGGGVAIADFDNDGLQDLFFTGNMVSNRLYQNLGDLNFKEITNSSGTAAKDFWCSGVSIIDINQDGYKDIYISTNTYENPNRRKNLLFVNITEGKNIQFKEQAEEYGIADTSYCMSSVFFDYDNDDDLDLFIITNKIQKSNDVSIYKRNKNNKGSNNIDVLYRNDWNEKLGHAFYTDVSETSGIIEEGFSLGVSIADINQDGWKDIYICNDFITNDILYINNQDGTFSNKINDYLKHTCMAAMGCDIADINNDGLQDILALDMLPEYNYRRKTMVGANNYSSYLYNIDYDYMHQFSRNVLQLNNGIIPELGHVTFSDISLSCGIGATDWSWSPLIQDFDANGFKDIIITNGFPKDVTDKDFMDYKSTNNAFASKETLLSMIPEVKLGNYVFKNEGNLSFKNVSAEWGVNKSSFSNGAAYGDLDNDGDLDYIVSNINDNAHFYRNNEIENKTKNNFIKIRLEYQKPNLEGLGAVIKYSSKNINSIYEHYTSRGYLSSNDENIYIGLGKDTFLHLEVIWPNGKVQKLSTSKINKLISIKYNPNSLDYDYKYPSTKPFFEINTNMPNIITKEIDYIDYNFDPLLLQKLSDEGPCITVGDLNSDDLDDFYICGSSGVKGKLYTQTSNGKYLLSNIELPSNLENEEISALIVDIDNDNDNDIYIANGSNQFNKNDQKLEDALIINDKGKFVNFSHILPKISINNSCIKACDYDKDGNIDLFIGGSAMPYEYPKNEASYILKNKGSLNFSVVETDVFSKLGMVTDALWTDYNNDGWMDLIITSQWNRIHFLENTNGSFKDNSKTSGINDLHGLWSSINACDIDNDGDTDYIIGNIGTNNLYNINKSTPAKLYCKDFDNNGSLDFIPTIFIKNKNEKYEETTYHSKNDLIKELVSYRKKYPSYKIFALSPIDSVINNKYRLNALILKADFDESIVLINDGKGRLKYNILPFQCQMSPINGIQLIDINNDGYKDLITSGNDYGVELTNGRMDASIGSLLLNNRKGNFDYVSPSKSGIYFSNDSKSLAIISQDNQLSLIQTSNNGPIKSYNLKQNNKAYTWKKDDLYLTTYSKNKKMYKEEKYIGCSKISQNTSTIFLSELIDKIEVTNSKMQRTIINL